MVTGLKNDEVFVIDQNHIIGPLLPCGIAASGAILDRMAIHLTDDAEADRLLSDDPLALLIGMLLDQQVA